MEVQQKIVAQSPIFEPNDLLPEPCNPIVLVMTYTLKIGRYTFRLAEEKHI
jgi:hypothetical protein